MLTGRKYTLSGCRFVISIATLAMICIPPARADLWNTAQGGYIVPWLENTRLGLGYAEVGNGNSIPPAMLDINTDQTETLLEMSYANKKVANLFAADAGSAGLLRLYSNGGASIGINFDARPSSSSFINVGKLGIGLTEPDHRLDVNGNTMVRGILRVNGDGNWVGSNEVTTYKDNWKIFMTGSSTDNGIMHIQTGDNENEPIFMEQGDKVRLAVASNGMIGIGKTNPTSMLHLYNSNPAHTSTYLTLERASLAQNETAITWKSPSGKTFLVRQVVNSEDLQIEASGLSGETSDLPRMKFPAANKNILACLSGGSLAVGTKTPVPGKKLHVAGNAKIDDTLEVGTMKTQIWSMGPDYVFEKGYKLNSLEHVEKFVNKEKHLPEIPSAKEMKEHGIDIAEMNLKLLKKVEELTLYAIDQRKKVIAHDAELAVLKAKIHDLESRK